MKAAHTRLASSETRLLTFTGPPGIGKTRIALALAAASAKQFGGVFFVDLSPVSDPQHVPAVIAIALDIEIRQGRALDSLVQHLQNERSLIVLDNLEHLLTAGPTLFKLLSLCPSLKLVATSREPLRLSSEIALSVLPLSVPPLDPLPAIDSLAQFSAIHLFLTRAQAVNPELRIDPVNSCHIAEICARLDGIPLAIELAAAEADVLRPVDILEGLRHQHIDFLPGGIQDSPERHRTLRRAIDWSYGLLQRDEQLLLQRLAVFVGGCPHEAAIEVCSLPQNANSCSTGVAGLVRKSLVIQEESAGEQRLRMLDMVREYALGQLEASGEAETVRERHADYFVRFAREAGQQIGRAEKSPWWIRRLGADHHNLRQAIDWLRRAGRTHQALHMAGALGAYWRESRRWDEGREVMEELLLTDTPPARTADRAEVLLHLGQLVGYGGDYQRARLHHRDALEIIRELNDDSQTIAALDIAASIASYNRDDKTATSLISEALALARHTGDKMLISSGLAILSLLALANCDYSAARAQLEECLTIDREASPLWAQLSTLQQLGYAAFEDGDHEMAQRTYTEALQLASYLALTPRIWWILEGFALLAASAAPGHAVQLAGAAAAVRDSLHPRPDIRQPHQLKLQSSLEALRTQMGREVYDYYWEIGYRMSVPQSIALALGTSPAPDAPRAHEASRGVRPVLSDREREIAGLAARGLTNRQIAARLVLSKRTVDTHLSRILRKLQLASRLELAAWMTENGAPGIRT